MNLKSPGSLSQYDNNSSGGSQTQKSPIGLTRQGTLRSSHRRKNSLGTSLNLNQGRRSPGLSLDQRSPQGRKSPILLLHEPSIGNGGNDRRSPTSNIVGGRRSPLSFGQGFDNDRRSPSSQFARRSPLGLESPSFDAGRRSPTSLYNQGRRSPTTESRQNSAVQLVSRKTSIGFNQEMINTITVSQMDKKSPIGNVPIPPITVSNPSETMALTSKTIEFNKPPEKEQSRPVTPEKKERPSVMRDILAFVRKPSNKKATTTLTATTSRTGRFAAAFSRAESSSATPLIRQSTFSTSPAASSRAGKSAVTKQMSEVGFESSKMSLKFSLNTKNMSLRMLRSNDDKKKDKKSSGDEMSETESSDSNKAGIVLPFELENVRFEKVGDSYIKHDLIKEENSLENTSPIKIVALSDTIAQNVINLDDDECSEQDREDLLKLKKSLEHIISNSSNSNLVVEDTDDMNIEKTDTIIKLAIQCPTVEIEPPSRRASFDPPRSPYLENFRSPLDNESKLDSGGESFELVETDRNRESSFEDRYSSLDTSFDISRYQSTSYEDQTSSFELVDIENSQKSFDDKKYDLRKSSIELVDSDTFQKSTKGRKSSLETHFDYTKPKKSDLPTSKSSFGVPSRAKKQISEPGRCRDQPGASYTSTYMKSHYSAPHRAKSPLSTQTSSNFSSRDSYDSSCEPNSSSRFTQSHSPTQPELKSPYSDPSRQHFPYPRRTSKDNQTFLCLDNRCSSIFEPRPSRTSSPYLGQGYSSGGEFDPPSPRRAASASPKHSFTFRIVMKKVDSSPDAICPSVERRIRNKKRDSKKRRKLDTGKSF